MGAICGMVTLNGDSVSTELSTRMMDGLKKFPFDNSGTWEKERAFFGSINKYITPESKNEKLPYTHLETGLVITADAIIDNRKELMTAFNISFAEGSRFTDSELIMKAYLKWGEECPRYIIGDYAFVIWNEKRKELFCARDHVGKKTFYFYHSKYVFAFCSVMNPLLQLSNDALEINDEWAAGFLALQGPVHEVDYSSTIYKNIQQLPPAYTMKMNPFGMTRKLYWNPLDVRELKLGSNKAYEEAFREVFFEAVHCRMRSIGSVGVMLSGGLDSGSIACVAARKLEEEGGRLKAFSSIPFSGYTDWLSKDAVADERKYIEAISQQYKNIDIKYCESEGKNSYNSIDELMDILEHPYKFVQNFFWLNEIASESEKAGCSVLLDGQSGNYTISFGDISSYIMTLYKKGKWVSALKGINEYSQFYNRNRNSVLRHFLVNLLPQPVGNFYRNVKGSNIEKNDDSGLVPVNADLALQWKVDNSFREKGLGPYIGLNDDIHKIRKFIANALLFSQAGEAETKLSLQYGIAKRDPSRDKRVIEFCMSLPPDQFVNNGMERSIIRRAMADILPDKVRLNFNVRGSQSADWVQRILPEWNQIKDELGDMLSEDSLKKYIDFNKVNSVVNDLGALPKDEEYYRVQLLMTSIIFRRFMNTVGMKK